MDGRDPIRAPSYPYPLPQVQVQLAQTSYPYPFPQNKIQSAQPSYSYPLPVQVQVQPTQPSYPYQLPQPHAQAQFTQQQQPPIQQPAPQNAQPSPEEQAAERRRARRLHYQNMALETVHAINNDIVDVSKTVSRTRYYPPDAPELVNWKHIPRHHFLRRSVRVAAHALTTLQGVRYFHSASSSPRRIGVLNFASATHPGGGFLEGARAQEESIARSSSLYVSLTTDTARSFYALHDQDGKGGFYSHAMIYSPNVHIFRDDSGKWVKPHQVDVLTSPAVNAGRVRKVYKQYDPQSVECWVRNIMYERIARILRLFERNGAMNLVLGSFGTGVFRNDVKTMAEIWNELLLSPGSRFGKSFHTVVFCIPDNNTRKEYEKVFQARRAHHRSHSTNTST